MDLAEPGRRSALRRAARVARRLGASVLVAVLLAEAGLRFVLFAETLDGTRLAAVFRRPDMYADYSLEDLYWLLLERFEPEALQRGPTRYDADLGWTNRLVEAGTYLHAERALVADRRPILLFGDSYAQCVTDSNDCFTALLERTDLARDHYLLNYGVGGFVLDQVLLLLRSTLDLYRESDPIVIVGIFVDDDFDRCALSFRQWPKPRMKVQDGELALEQQAVVRSYADYVRTTPPAAFSFLWRLVAHRSDSPELRRALVGIDDDEAEKRRVAAAILDAIQVELETRDLDHMVALFYTSQAVEDPARLAWRASLTRDALERHATRFVDVGSAMRERVASTGELVSSFYGAEGAGGGHYDATGNQIAFAAIADGLARFFGTPPAEAFVSPRDIARVVSSGTGSYGRFESENDPSFPEPEDRTRLSIGVGRIGPTEVHYELRGRARSFRASARLVPGVSAVGSVGLRITADGEPLLEREFRPSDPPLDIAVPLVGRSTLVISADDANDGHVGDRIVLSAPRFD